MTCDAVSGYEAMFNGDAGGILNEYSVLVGSRNRRLRNLDISGSGSDEDSDIATCRVNGLTGYLLVGRRYGFRSQAGTPGL
jgi:hypothetical protein